MRFLVQLTGSFAELVGGLGVKRLELLCACFLFIHHSLFEELLHASLPPFRKGLRCLYDFVQTPEFFFARALDLLFRWYLRTKNQAIRAQDKHLEWLLSIMRRTKIRLYGGNPSLH